MSGIQTVRYQRRDGTVGTVEGGPRSVQRHLEQIRREDEEAERAEAALTQNYEADRPLIPATMQYGPTLLGLNSAEARQVQRERKPAVYNGAPNLEAPLTRPTWDFSDHLKSHQGQEPEPVQEQQVEQQQPARRAADYSGAGGAPPSFQQEDEYVPNARLMDVALRVDNAEAPLVRPTWDFSKPRQASHSRGRPGAAPTHNDATREATDGEAPLLRPVWKF